MMLYTVDTNFMGCFRLNRTFFAYKNLMQPKECLLYLYNFPSPPVLTNTCYFIKVVTMVVLIHHDLKSLAMLNVLLYHQTFDKICKFGINKFIFKDAKIWRSQDLVISFLYYFKMVSSSHFLTSFNQLIVSTTDNYKHLDQKRDREKSLINTH